MVVLLYIVGGAPFSSTPSELDDSQGTSNASLLVLQANKRVDSKILLPCSSDVPTWPHAPCSAHPVYGIGKGRYWLALMQDIRGLFCPQTSLASHTHRSTRKGLVKCL